MASSPSFIEICNLHTSFAQDAFSQIVQYSQNSTLTDFSIYCEGNQVIKCHKVILAATCPYFSDLFTSGKKESQQPEFTSSHFSFHVLDAIVKYIYAVPKISLEWKNLKEAIEACEFFQLAALKNLLALHIVQNINEDNCIGWLKFALEFDLQDVEHEAKQMMCGGHLGLVSAGEEFKLLDLAELIDYMNELKDEINDRDSLLVPCMEWIQYNQEERKQDMSDILRHIQLDQCSLSSLNDIQVKYRHLIVDCPVESVIIDTIRQKEEEENYQADDKDVGEEEDKKRLVVLGGLDENHQVNTFCWFQDDEKEWIKFAEIPIDILIADSRIVSLSDGFAVLCGGENKSKNMKYKAANKTWKTLPDTPCNYINPAAEVCDDKIYLIHGNLGTDMYHLDLRTMQWDKDPDMWEKMLETVATSSNRKLYVLNERTSNFQCFNTELDKWGWKSALPAVDIGIRGASFVASDRSLYLIADNVNTCTTSLHHYSTQLDTWTKLTSSNARHYWGSAVAHKGNIHVCGNYISDSWSSASEVFELYDIEEDEWSWSKSTVKLPMLLWKHKTAFVSFVTAE